MAAQSGTRVSAGDASPFWAQVRAEALKHRTTRTNASLFLAMLALLLFAVLLHALLLPKDQLVTSADQLKVFTWGTLGALFAALVGAMSMTGELRSGTIRSTFLVTPKRWRVFAAKAATSAVIGLAFGFVAEAVAGGVGSLALNQRGVTVTLAGGDYALLLVGGACAGALWAVAGLAIGAIVRNQVATVIGIFGWLLFVENLLLGNAPDVARFAPGWAGAAIAGQDPDTLLSPLFGLLLLAGYVALASLLGLRATAHRDVP